MSTTWTRFMDMHSGGGLKEDPYSIILIETDEDAAKRVFYSRFGHNPERITCTCCGEDYSVSSITDDNALAMITAYDRHASVDEDGNEELDSSYMRHHKNATVIPLPTYLNKPDVLVIRDDEITDEDKETYVPPEGWLWV
jgi:hypothetical protein